MKKIYVIYTYVCVCVCVALWICEMDSRFCAANSLLLSCGNYKYSCDQHESQLRVFP